MLNESGRLHMVTGSAWKYEFVAKTACGSIKSCAKCDEKEFSRTFVPAFPVPQACTYYHESLKVECKSCGAVFYEKTKDASE